MFREGAIEAASAQHSGQAPNWTSALVMHHSPLALDKVPAEWLRIVMPLSALSMLLRIDAFDCIELVSDENVAALLTRGDPVHCERRVQQSTSEVEQV